MSKPHALLGPAIWIFGAFLWAYVILGEYTTAGVIGEGLAVLAIILVTGVSWIIAVRRSLVVPLGHLGMLGRILAPGIIALALSFLCAIAATSLSESSHKNQDTPITLTLMLLSALAFVGGRRLTGPSGISLLPKNLALLLTGCGILASLGAAVHMVVSN